MTNKINIIDLFSGPGGLGEGFSSFTTSKGRKETCPFSIVMSVEKEKSAHQTLQLRAFFRKFRHGKAPDEYYQYLREPDKCSKKELYRLYPDEAQEAVRETHNEPRELGTDDDRSIFRELASLKKNHKGPWVVIGGPPCQAYSLVGRSRNAGVKGYKAEEDKRNFLYKEYLKVLEEMKPEIFVMENVKGILSATVQGQIIFPQLLRDLRNPQKAISNRRGPDYNIFSLVSKPDDFELIEGPVYKKGSEFVIRCERYGIPQTRHRVILLGVRSDLDRIPNILSQTPQTVSIDKVIENLPKLRSGLSKQPDGDREWQSVMHEVMTELTKELTASGNRKLARYIKELSLNEPNTLSSRGGQFVRSSAKGFARGYKGALKDWIYDSRLKGFPNHESKRHMKSDLMRYLWCAAFTSSTNREKHPSPRSSEFPGFLAPNHNNWDSANFTNRFRVQAKGFPAATIVSHISKDGHYYIHYDPVQCRSLTVREAARIQTFPDNYFFEGNKTQQFEQVGNAVPPFLARQIADIVYQILFNR